MSLCCVINVPVQHSFDNAKRNLRSKKNLSLKGNTGVKKHHISQRPFYLWIYTVYLVIVFCISNSKFSMAHFSTFFYDESQTRQGIFVNWFGSTTLFPYSTVAIRLQCLYGEPYQKKKVSTRKIEQVAILYFRIIAFNFSQLDLQRC
jgi:hypothetical protein